MKPILAFAFFTLAAAAGDPGYHAQFVGGTLADVRPKTSARLQLSDPGMLIFACHGQTLHIDYSRINGLEYGQNVSRRFAAALLVSPLFLLSKSRQHFVTIGYTDPEGKQEALLFRVDKRDIRGVLTTLEARSGRRVEFQDDEARKTGK